MKALPFIYFTILLIINSIHKKRFIAVSNLLIGAYALSGLCFLILSNFIEYDINIYATLFYLLCLSFLIIPHIYFDEDRIRVRIVKLTHTPIKNIYLIYFIIQILAILYFLPDAINAMSGDILFKRQLINIGEYKVRGTIDLYISFVGYSWPISLTMFYYCIISKEKPFYSLMFLTCSLFGVIYVMAYLGRSGITHWFMLLLFNYILFRKHLNDKMKSGKGSINIFKFIKIIVYTLLVLMIVIFISFTTGRYLMYTAYTNSYIGGYLMTIIEYFGQNYGNFNNYYTNNWLDQKLYYGQFTAPVLYGILKLARVTPNYSYESVLNEIYSFHLSNGLQRGTFNTLLKEISIDYGFLGLFILCVLYFCICLKVIRNKGRLWGLSAILIYTFLFTIPYYGLFFYSYGDSLTNLTMVYYIISAFLFRRFLKT